AAVPTVEAPVAPPPSDSNIQVGLRAGVHAELLPFGANVDLALLVGGARWGSHRFAMGAMGRMSYPSELGSGRVLAVLAAAGLSWKWMPDRLGVGLEVRSGPLWLSGVGFPQNKAEWLPWVELAPSVSYVLGGVTLGLEVAATPLVYTASVPPLTRTHAPLRV